MYQEDPIWKHIPKIMGEDIKHPSSAINLAGTLAMKASKWIPTLLDDVTALAAIRQRSYTHPNGFLRILLTSYAECPVEIAVHIWPGLQDAHKVNATPYSAHSHAAFFASAVLSEGIIEDRFSDNNNLNGENLYAVCRSKKREVGTLRQLVAGRWTTLEHVNQSIHIAGEVYSCPTVNIHDIETSSTARTAATLCVSGPQVSVPDVYVKDNRQVGVFGVNESKEPSLEQTKDCLMLLGTL